MIDLYYWPTPNGHKITIFLEEAELPYKIIPVDVGSGNQFKNEFLKVSPNNSIPAIVDHFPLVGGPPISVFESGAILVYLADKIGEYLPSLEKERERFNVLQWLFWQAEEFGGNQNETNRLNEILDRQLEGKPFVCGDYYSIADMAIYPWIVPYELQAQDLARFQNLKRWFNHMKSRSAVKRAYQKEKQINLDSPSLVEFYAAKNFT